jgi:hypothetical protein
VGTWHVTEYSIMWSIMLKSEAKASAISIACRQWMKRRHADLASVHTIRNIICYRRFSWNKDATRFEMCVLVGMTTFQDTEV